MKNDDASHPLKDIIQSLSSSEKRYVKIELQAKKAEQSALLTKLFDLVEKQENYDDAKTKQQLSKQFSFSNFAVVKNTLYEIILDSLLSFHAENNVDVLLQKQLSYAEILKQKSQVEATQKQLDKAATLAQKYERFGILADIKQRQSLMQLESGDMKIVGEYYETGSEDELQISDFLREINTAKKLAAQTILLAKKFGGLSQAESSNELKKIREHPTLAAIENLQTFHGKMYARTTLGVITSLEKSILHSLENRLALHEMFKQHPHFVPDKIQLYTGNLYNICVTFLTLENISDCEKFLNLLQSETERHKPAFTEENRALTQLRICNLRLQLCAHTADYTSVKNIVDEVAEIEKKHGNKKLEEFILSSYTYAAMLFYLGGNYDASLQYVNLLLNTREKELRRDVMLYARFLIIALHYKMDNHVLIEYELKNLRYFLQKNFSDQDLGKRFADFFHLLLHDKNKLQKNRSQYLPLFAHAGSKPTIYESMFDAVAESVVR